LKVEKHNERFDDQLHGRMSARADMEDEKVRKNMEEDTRHYWSSSESTSRRAMDRLLLIPVRSSRAVRLLWESTWYSDERVLVVTPCVVYNTMRGCSKRKHLGD